ncbi:hypothetical protein GIB67_038991 [Kingdonia uniflora]|uniref:Uncharacterized protein n=1 Tax=Kingdonia uniflora TaxID=39325 RepID=A0A7J7P7B5_9MAGN|nr:hypothetical protein GIB67_038991 [Kingdonia uniflora]
MLTLTATTKTPTIPNPIDLKTDPNPIDFKTDPNPLSPKPNSSTKITHSDISSNIMWPNIKATLNQCFNWEGITAAVSVVTKDRHLALPHIAVRDIRSIDWAEMERRGFRGVVFDKDNTITAPYSLSVWPPLVSNLEQCKSVFGDNIIVFSNSAGLYQYDPDGLKARAVEDSLGIHVIRHGAKKPDGTAEDIEKYFGCPTSLLIMVGDRHFTDVVFGNRNGLLTILAEPLTSAEEPFVVKQVRRLEAALVNYWHRRGLKPKNHNLLSEAMECIKVP